MDVFEELEAMVQSALQLTEEHDEPDYIDTKKWQRLFGYSHSEAIQKIKAHRSNLSRITVSASHWDLIRNEKEAQGYDKEAYEYSCGLMTTLQKPAIRRARNSSSGGSAPNASRYLLKLEGPLNDVKKVKCAAGLTSIPVPLNGTNDTDDDALFCEVDSKMKDNILDYLSRTDASFQPTFVRYSKAKKELSDCSAYPTLGYDTTLPQHRPGNLTSYIPSQDQYPVWYFFYGTLGTPEVLKSLLGYDALYVQAKVHGGILKTWGGKYNALIDAPKARSIVQGQAFLVQNCEEEDCLRLYETDRYEVVRCDIDMGGERVERGLTFRFIGDCDQ